MGCGRECSGQPCLIRAAEGGEVSAPGRSALTASETT